MSDPPQAETSKLPTATSDPDLTITYGVEMVTTEEGLLCLKDDWERLEETLEEENVFAGFAWGWATWHHFGPFDVHGGNKQLLTAVLHRDSKVTGLAPFWIRNERRFGFNLRKIEFLRGGGPSGMLRGQ